MRQSAFLLGVLVFLAGTAGAQARVDNPDSAGADGTTISQQASAPQLFASAADPLSGAAGADSASPQGTTPQNPGGVQSVFPQYNWQGYLGYTYARLYEGPNYTKNLNGFNMAIDYFPHAGHLAADAELVATFGSQSNHLAQLWAVMGGGRYRFAAPRGMEVWVHGLVGGAKFVPQTAFGNGSQTGFAYETGAGVDIGAWNHRFAFRFSGDLLGTRFFGQNQFSPKVSAGIVFKY